MSCAAAKVKSSVCGDRSILTNALLFHRHGDGISWARHDSWFSRALEDLVVYDAINLQEAGGFQALRHQLAGGRPHVP
jgi:hypothetical protein